MCERETYGRVPDSCLVHEHWLHVHLMFKLINMRQNKKDAGRVLTMLCGSSKGERIAFREDWCSVISNIKKVRIEKEFLDLLIIVDLLLNVLFKYNLHAVKCINLTSTTQ